MKNQTINTLYIITYLFFFIIIMGIILKFIQKESFLVLPTEPYEYKVVHRNNGTVSCQTYCAGTSGNSWNRELPQEWNGANCIDTIGGGNCNNTKGSPTTCVCAPNNKGWN
jgi:hypothetical protein